VLRLQGSGFRDLKLGRVSLSTKSIINLNLTEDGNPIPIIEFLSLLITLHNFSFPLPSYPPPVAPLPPLAPPP
jgi:hypothetical protein